MLIVVLGSAAGGGFPQWNCGCQNCAGVRTGAIRATPRTEDALAVSADGEAWYLLNASGDVRRQLESCPRLHPRAPRHTPLAGIVLTNGDVDHVAGLLALRESQPLVVHATACVRRGFTETNALARTLDRFPGQTTWRALPLGREVPLGDAGLGVTAIPAPGKLPIHLAGRVAPDIEENVGLRVRDARTGGVLAYFPGVGALTADVRAALAEADAVFFDGTFWASDELVALGLGGRRAEDMAHLPVGGPAGSLALLAGLHASRRLYTHVNNTNPLLRDDSPERARVAAAGWEVTRDGMELRL